jgi:superfamily II DNA or RNA helicase
MLGSQLRDDFVKAGINCGLCSGKGIIKGDCMVSTIQSVKKLGDLSRYKCVLIDESHNASSSQFQDFLKQFGCPLKFGFSASPFRNGDYLGYAKIRQFVGSPIIKIESKELLENEVMAKPHIYLVKNECKEDEYFDYQTAYTEEIVNSAKRNNIIKDITDIYKTGILIVVNIVEHGEILQDLIPNSMFISGETPIDIRKQTIEDFDNGNLPVLIGSTILQEGISITHMKAMILACGGKSNVAVLQKIGRSLRFKEGEKTEVDYYDFIDTAKFLSKHSKMRATLYKKAGYDDIKLLTSDLQEIKK